MRTRAAANACLAVLGLALAAPAMAGGAQEDYILYCMGCHGPAGRGVPGRVPPVSASLALFMRSAEGREYLARVPGAANSPVSDARLAGVYNWALRRFGGEQLAASVEPFTAAEVSTLRHRPLADVKARRRAVVASLRATGPAPAEDY